jgi:hypothetical protein
MALLYHEIVRQVAVQRLIAASGLELKTAMEERLQTVLAKLAQRREVIDERSQDRGRGMSM